jgi:hypothetical protein
MKEMKPQDPSDTVLDLDPTPAQIHAVMSAMSRRRTPEQRVGGRPRGYVMSEESRAKIGRTRAERRATKPSA